MRGRARWLRADGALAQCLVGGGLNPNSFLSPHGLLRVWLITVPSLHHSSLPHPSFPSFLSFYPFLLSLLLSVSGFREVSPKHVSET